MACATFSKVTNEEASREAEKAIVFVDLVGSTPLKKIVGGDLPYLLRVLLPYLESLRKNISNYEGWEISTTGDGMLLLFQTVDDAVRYAIDFYTEISRTTDKTLSDVAVRVGIHFGAITFYADNREVAIVGENVDYAAPVCACANPGQVLLSRAATTRLSIAGIHLYEFPGFVLKGFAGVHSLFELLWGNKQPKQSVASTRICEKLLCLLRTSNDFKEDVGKEFVRVNLKSVKYNLTWEYEIKSSVRCSDLAEALSEQHFSPFHGTFQWFLCNDSGIKYDETLTLKELGLNDNATVVLYYSSEGPIMDPARMEREDPLFYLEHELFCTGDFRTAIWELKRLIRTFPEDSRVLQSLADAYLETNRKIRTARRLLSDFIRLSPSSWKEPSVRDSFGWLFYREGDFRQAEENLLYALNNTSRERDTDGYNTTLYHLYFTWRKLRRKMLAELTRRELSAWVSEYNKAKIFQERVAADNDSLMLPVWYPWSPSLYRLMSRLVYPSYLRMVRKERNVERQ